MPDSIVRSLRLPEGEAEERLGCELALSLYARGILSFGKATEFSGVSRWQIADFATRWVSPGITARRNWRKTWPLATVSDTSPISNLSIIGRLSLLQVSVLCGPDPRHRREGRNFARLAGLSMRGVLGVLINDCHEITFADAKPLTDVRGSEILVLSRDRKGVGWSGYFVTGPKWQSDGRDHVGQSGNRFVTHSGGIFHSFFAGVRGSARRWRVGPSNYPLLLLPSSLYNRPP